MSLPEQWHINSPSWGPHLLVAWFIVGENPEASSLARSSALAPPRAPLYKWLVVRALDGYGDSMVAAQQAAKSTGPPALL